jgi:hypothetical protein
VEALASGGAASEALRVAREWRGCRIHWRGRRVEGTASEALASEALASGAREWRDGGSTGGDGEWRGRRGAGEALADPLEGIGGSCEARGVGASKGKYRRGKQ